MSFIKQISVVATTFCIFSANSYAACYCSEPSAPIIPSGYYAESYQMESARNDVESYLEEVKNYKQCLVRCVESINSEAEDVIDEWNSAVQQYNNQ